LRVVPSGINARAGASAPITVYALRKDGFSGEITLSLKDPPKGFTLSGARVPAGQDRVRLTLTVPPSPPGEPVNLRLEGRAMIQDHEIHRPAVPADDMMQAFIYHHLVPAKKLMVAAAGRGGARGLTQISRRDRGIAPLGGTAEEPVKLPAGGTTPVEYSVPRGPLRDQIRLALNEPPEGIAIKKVTRTQNVLTILLTTDAGKVKPGLKGNLILDVFLERASNPGDGKPQANQRRILLGTLPALPYEIVKR
jgi:hypothetical protein